MKWYLLKDASKPKSEQYTCVKAEEAELLHPDIVADFYKQQGKELVAEGDSFTAIMLHLQALLADEKEE